MGESIKKRKKWNIICFFLLFFETVSIIFCLGTQVYVKFHLNDSQTLMTLISVFRFISYIVFCAIILISIFHLKRTKKINLIHILILAIAICPLVYERDKKAELWPVYGCESGGNRIVLEKGHDFLGYFIKVDILYLPDWAADNPDMTIDKVYCKKEDYDNINQYQIYNMYYYEDELMECGLLTGANDPFGDPWKKNFHFPPKYTPEDFE